MPLFWQPINLLALKYIYLLEVILGTVFNPVFLIEQLKMMGIKIEFENKMNPKQAYVKKADYHIGIPLYNFFYQLITRHLFEEDKVCLMINQLLTKIEELGIKERAKIDINFLQL